MVLGFGIRASSASTNAEICEAVKAIRLAFDYATDVRRFGIIIESCLNVTHPTILFIKGDSHSVEKSEWEIVTGQGALGWLS